jgi:hypothetical protein
MKRQAQINQDTMQDLQELKNSLDKIESHLKNAMTQYGDNEIENPQVDDDEPNDVEEDGDVHELNAVETLEQDHFNMSLQNTA